MDLLERDAERAVLAGAIEESRESGRVVLVVGEAGIGKTALVADVCRDADGVLWGACDPLITPRPMGPLRDVADRLGDEFQSAIEAGARERVLTAMLSALAGGAVLVIEDLHWADDATLDLVALLGRRLARAPGCVIMTSRVEPRIEVRRVLGALPREALRRIEPAALSAEAVAELAQRAGRDPADLHAVSGGNPFFVTEALAAPDGGGVPASVREAVALRLALIGDAAGAVVELVAVNPGPAELWLVEADPAAVDECIAAGLLSLHGETLAFRHDLARRAIEDGLSPLRRRELDLRVLAALEAAGDADPARLAHHARRAGDPDAIRRLAPVAARAAAAAGGHRQALEHWEAAVAVSPHDPDALEGVSVEAYLCGRTDLALEARRTLLRLHEAAGQTRAAGDDLRWLSRILWWAGQGMEAAAVGDMAIATLEAFPDSRELAMALSGRSQLAMLAWESERAIELGTRAIRLARRIDDRETVTHALTNVGTALLGGDDHDQGVALLEEAFTLAREIGSDDHAVRALINLGVGTLAKTRRDNGGIDRALAFASERELDGYVQYALGVRANLRLLRGEWREAEADARASLALGEQPGVSLCPALFALGRLQARRGDEEAGETLEHAWRLAVASQELQRLGPAAAARAEHAWLDGDLAGTAAAARTTYQLAVDRGEPWSRAELAFWLRRAGEPVHEHDRDPEPYALALAGDWGGAAAAFGELGFTYDRADMLTESDDEEARLEALAILDRLGAVRSASHLRRRLRADGVRRNPPWAAAGIAGRDGRPDAARDRSVGADRRGGDQRRDRPRTRDLAQDGRPPRVRGAGKARRGLTARGGRRGVEAHRGLAPERLGRTRAMPTLPFPRGPVSEALIAALRDPPHPVAVPSGEIEHEDLHLALYCCYELHYRGFDGVDDAWEWEPPLLALRAALERRFEAELLDLVGAPGEPPAPEEIDAVLREVMVSDDAPSVSTYIERDATAAQIAEFMIHRSAYQLKEADPHSWALPRLWGAPKAAMVEIQADEYGGGRADQIHAELFARAMDAVGLDSRYGAYLDQIPAVTLATVNLMSLLGLHRRWRGAIVGHLALFEMTSSIPNRRYGAGLRRLGYGEDATAFFDVHVVADAVHESIAAVDLAGGLARQDPKLGADVIWGARALLALDGVWARHVMSAWEAGDSSLSLLAVP